MVTGSHLLKQNKSVQVKYFYVSLFYSKATSNIRLIVELPENGITLISLSCSVNFESFQPTFVLSCWEWDFTGECGSMCPSVLCSDFGGLCFMYQS